MNNNYQKKYFKYQKKYKHLVQDGGFYPQGDDEEELLNMIRMISMQDQSDDQMDLQQSVVETQEPVYGERFPSRDVRADGNCFFYSLYNALKHHNLLTEFLSGLGLDVRLNEDQFNMELRRILGRKFYHSPIFSDIYNAYLNSQQEPGTYQLYSQVPESEPYELKVLPNITDNRPLERESFKNEVNHKINQNGVFPIGVIISLIQEDFDRIFSRYGIKLNYTPNRVELFDGMQTTIYSPDEIQFIRPQDFDRKTVYIHKITAFAHYHWIETPKIRDVYPFDPSFGAAAGPGSYASRQAQEAERRQQQAQEAQRRQRQAEEKKQKRKQKIEQRREKKPSKSNPYQRLQGNTKPPERKDYFLRFDPEKGQWYYVKYDYSDLYYV